MLNKDSLDSHSQLKIIHTLTNLARDKNYPSYLLEKIEDSIV